MYLKCYIKGFTEELVPFFETAKNKNLMTNFHLTVGINVELTS